MMTPNLTTLNSWYEIPRSKNEDVTQQFLKRNSTPVMAGELHDDDNIHFSLKPLDLTFQKGKQIVPKFVEDQTSNNIIFAKNWLKDHSGVSSDSTAISVCALLIAYIHFCHQKNEEPLEKSTFIDLVHNMFPNISESKDYQHDLSQIKNLGKDLDLLPRATQNEKIKQGGVLNLAAQQNNSQIYKTSDGFQNKNCQDDDQSYGLNHCKLSHHFRVTPTNTNCYLTNQTDSGRQFDTDDSDSERHSSDSGFESPDLSVDTPMYTKSTKLSVKSKYAFKKVLFENRSVLKRESPNGNESKNSFIPKSKSFSTSQSEIGKLCLPLHNVLVSTSPASPVDASKEGEQPVLNKFSIKREVEISDEFLADDPPNTRLVTRKREVSQNETKKVKWSHWHEKVIQNVIQLLDLKDFESSPCFEHGKRVSQIMIGMLKARQLQLFLSIFCHSVTCKENHTDDKTLRNLCPMFRRMIHHVITSKHHCAIKEMYGHILRLHLDTCTKEDCGFPKCKSLRENRKSKAVKQPE